MQETRLESPIQSSLIDYVSAHGSNAAPYMCGIADNFSSLTGADIADITHFLCILHGRHPGVVDHAATKTADERARDWLVQAMDAFTAERAFLTKLTVAAGPISGVGAMDQSNSTVLAQRKALEMLSQSDRNGCALGASFALVLDWFAIRPLLESIALKLNIEPRSAILPSPQSTVDLKQALIATSGMERAINFGVDQILAQHRGLWQLLESRSKARIAD